MDWTGSPGTLIYSVYDRGINATNVVDRGIFNNTSFYGVDAYTGIVYDSATGATNIFGRGIFRDTEYERDIVAGEKCGILIINDTYDNE